MKQILKQAKTSESGFTLVELAIVLIIVGLLIGGILKGQELIGNAQVTAQSSEMRALEAATSGFRDQFAAIAGDVANANLRIPNCLASPCWTALATLGNGILNSQIGAAPALTTETVYYFNQLRSAGYLSNFDGTNALTFGQALPPAAIQGGYSVGDTRAGAMTGFTAAEFRPGVYITAVGASNAAVALGNGSLTPSQAARIDRKIDDGVGATGLVIVESLGTTAAGGTSCRAGAVAAGQNFYDEVANNKLCSIAYRVR